MNIECPSCSSENKIEFGENIVCSECKESFAGHTYKKYKKPLISAATALFIGVYGTYKVDDIFFDDKRYPVAIEYELLDACVNSSNILSGYYRTKEKKGICVCALEKTMSKIEYKDMNESETKFLSHFRSGVSACR